MNATLPLLERTDFPALQRRVLETLQVNLGYRCNQSCVHCHVNAGPNRTEMMDGDTLRLVPEVLRARDVRTLDLTGGAPELHAGFRWLVSEASRLGVQVIDRCNLTILFEPGQEDLAAFLAAIASRSSPRCRAIPRTTSIGSAARASSTRASQRCSSSTRSATGAKAPGWRSTWSTTRRVRRCRRSRTRLEADYKRELFEHFGIVFNRPVHAGQHADPALRLHAGVQGPV